MGTGIDQDDGQKLVDTTPSTTSKTKTKTSTVSSKATTATTFQGNRVRTARYTVVTFLPLQLWLQFSKLPNLYFLFIGLLQQIPGISPTGQFTTIGPLILFVALAMAREAYDDRQRHRQDDVENRSIAYVWRADQAAWVPIAWQDVVVGDLVRIRRDEPIPADILLLHSSDVLGACYVETSSLDGESNLKERQALKHTQQLLCDGRAAAAYQGTVHAEAPSSLLYNFDGYLEHNGVKHALTASQLLLRGAVLKNTAEVFGVVLFAGEETKMRLNATAAPSKSPTMERMTNRVVVAIFIFLLLLTLVFSILAVVWENNLSTLTYMAGYTAPSWISLFATFLILFNTLIPISLYVTLEFVKLVQAKLIEYDGQMFHPESGTFAAARTSSLNEELGQVEYVFSDKTGTLTENVMLFRRISVGGVAFSHTSPPKAASAAPAGGAPPAVSPEASPPAVAVDALPLRSLSAATRPASQPDSSSPNLGDQRSSRDLAQLRQDANHRDLARAADELLLSIALCHTVVPFTDSADGGVVQYQGSSPDEVALVQGAAELGCVLADRRAEVLSVRLGGLTLDYEVLHVLQFTSDRKRMSVIYREPDSMPDGRIVLYCKGADQVILERVRAADAAAVRTTQAHVDAFAKDGLRTLAYAMAELPMATYLPWEKTFLEASLSLQNRQALMDAAAEVIETNLVLLGATAIEDRLQGGVPDTIASLQHAGIHVWVLTGDKLETAVNIGYASALIKPESTVVTLTHSDDPARSLKRQINQAFTNIADAKDVVLVVEGSTLTALSTDDKVYADFLALGMHAHSVICCRVSPIQKAEIVAAVRHRLKKVTLAIGDGANDISMIQAAHVGIGITGREGLQAARASDYTIAQFRFLKRLLLIHGHWSYVRNAKFLLGSFYKCFAFYLTQAIFQGFDGYTGTSLYEQWTLASYNVFFALLPVIFVGIFEQDAPEAVLLRVPELYKSGRESELYNLRKFATWTLFAIFHAFVMALVPIFLFGYFPGLHYNQDDGLYVLGTIAYTGVIFVVTFKIGFVELRHWTWANIAVNWGTIAFWFLFQAVYSQLPRLSWAAYGLFDALWRNTKFPFTVLLVVVAALLPDVVYKFVRVLTSPSDAQILAERVAVTGADLARPSTAGRERNEPLLLASLSADPSVGSTEQL